MVNKVQETSQEFNTTREALQGKHTLLQDEKRQKIIDLKSVLNALPNKTSEEKATLEKELREAFADRYKEENRI